MAGMASYNIYEKYLCGEPAFYLRDKIRVIADFSHLGNFGKGCLEKEKSAIRENQMRIDGWVFLIISWGIILVMAVFCFVKVFSKKELK